MANETMTLIETVTVGTAAADITFSSIPNGGLYTDLMIVISGRSTSSANAYSESGMYFNGATYPDATASFRSLEGTGSGTSSNSVTNYLSAGWNCGSGMTANTFSNNVIYIPNYAGSTQKSVSVDSVSENNATAAYQRIIAGKSTITAAITSIRLNAETAWAVGSTASLYGIKKATELTAKATGGTITYGADGYVYHAFTSSGTFTPTSAISADVLVVAGGGGGGYFGGGGAGGVQAFTGQSLTTTGYTVTVGAGGTATLSGTGNSNGGAGGNSQFGSLAASVGGGGGIPVNGSGGSGGSGGGAVNTSAGLGTSGQGNNGGTGIWGGGGVYAGGGGGGASAIGANYSSGHGGEGGNGTSAYSGWGIVTGTGQNVSGTYYYGGGGGGGTGGGLGGTSRITGGYGGGGAGGNDANSSTFSGVAATANTGGGGGALAYGAGSGYTSGTGGSGIVIVRYLG